MTSETMQMIENASQFLRGRIAQSNLKPPRIALVLGSGLGEFADCVEDPLIVPFAEVPHFPQSTVEGHTGRMVFGSVGGVAIAVMQGRVHAYEGYSPAEVVFPTRVLARLGTKQIILTNASGSLRQDFAPGSLVALSDHINLTGANPCVGPNDSQLGPRFFDMGHAYSPRLRQLARHTATEQGWEMPEGVYLGVSGPSFETPAEIRFFRVVGADLVGMSTVQEVIAARHIGLEVLAISCVTNLAAGIGKAELNHAEVMETGARVGKRLIALLTAMLPALAALPETSA
ncbi:MAG: purine-nucleoside phosphorylase [Acidobacteriaceae bacterium]